MEQVTVLMSTYNGAKYLREQIDSILAQKGVSVRLIARDDGSSDGTVGLLRAYAAEGKLELIAGENLGPALSFMRLLYDCGADADYCAFADQDDIWLPEKLHRAVTALGRQTCPALYASNQMLVDADGREMGLRFSEPPAKDIWNIIDKNILSGCTMVLNRQLLELLRDRQPEAEVVKKRMHDTWAAAVAAATGRVIYDRKAYILYRQHGGNVVGAKRADLPELVKKRMEMILSRAREYHAVFAEELLRLYGDVLLPEAAHAVSLYRKADTPKGKAALLMDARFRKKYRRSLPAFALRLLLS